MVAAQGGPVDLLQRPDEYLPAAALIRPVPAVHSGYVQSVDVKAIGLAVVRLGGGRMRAEDPVDHSVGISHLCQPGARLEADTPIAILHARTEKQWSSAAEEIRQAVELVDIPLGRAQSPAVWERIEGAQNR
jgi:thymidine phosphorylase